MLTPEQFSARWRSEVVAKDSVPGDLELLTVSPERPASGSLSEPARQFLAKAGLPRGCAPCLCFEEVGKGLPKLWEVFAPGQWDEKEKTSLQHYLLLGSDGSGNPICVDTRDQRIVL